MAFIVHIQVYVQQFTVLNNNLCSLDTGSCTATDQQNIWCNHFKRKGFRTKPPQLDLVQNSNGKIQQQL